MRWFQPNLFHIFVICSLFHMNLQNSWIHKCTKIRSCSSSSLEHGSAWGKPDTHQLWPCAGRACVHAGQCGVASRDAVWRRTAPADAGPAARRRSGVARETWWRWELHRGNVGSGAAAVGSGEEGCGVVELGSSRPAVEGSPAHCRPWRRGSGWSSCRCAKIGEGGWRRVLIGEEEGSRRGPASCRERRRAAVAAALRPCRARQFDPGAARAEEGDGRLTCGPQLIF
jgi:hypothetical protein